MVFLLFTILNNWAYSAINGFLASNAQPFIINNSWTKNGNGLTNTTDNINLNVDDQGTYQATIIDLNGCTGISNELVIADSASSKLFVYPNPNRGQFQVRFFSAAGNQLPRSMLVYDAKGALVYNQVYSIGRSYDKMDVDFSKFSKGVYFINLLDNAGKRLAVGKVAVQ